MFSAALVQRLSNIAPNLYPVVAPLHYQTPCVVYNLASSQPLNDLQGADDAFMRVQIDVYDPVYLNAKAVAKSIRDDLNGWHDADVAGVTWTDEADMIDQTTEKTLYRVMMIFSILAAV